MKAPTASLLRLFVCATALGSGGSLLLLRAHPSRAHSAQKGAVPPPRIVASGKVAWDAIDEINEANRKLGNGIDLTVELTTEKDHLRIGWKMVYKGPRPPLVILEPSLEGDYDHTQIRVFAKDKNGVVRDLLLMAPYSRFSPAACDNAGFVPNAVKRSRFLTADENGLLNGELYVSTPRLRMLFQTQWPEEFNSSSRLLAIQLIHMPMDRGESWELDAWTGNVMSPIVALRKE